jgi:hypothetical protein
VYWSQLVVVAMEYGDGRLHLAEAVVRRRRPSVHLQVPLRAEVELTEFACNTTGHELA